MATNPLIITSITNSSAPSIKFAGLNEANAANQTTQTTLTYLDSTDDPTRDESFLHLIRILMRATKGLYLPSFEKSLAAGPHDPETYDAAWKFRQMSSDKFSWASEWLLVELAPYQGMPTDLLVSAANENAFRYLARKFRCKLINRIRDEKHDSEGITYSRYDEGVNYEAIDSEELPDVGNPAENEITAAHDLFSRPAPLEPAQYAALVEQCEFLSPKSKALALSLYDLADQSKGGITRAISASREVSEQQARRDKAKMQQEFQAALKAGNKRAKEVFDILSKYVIRAQSRPRDLNFWSRKNDGTSTQTSAFDGYYYPRLSQNPKVYD